MTQDELLTLIVCIIFAIIGTYYNYKFNQIGKEEHKKQ